MYKAGKTPRLLYRLALIAYVILFGPRLVGESYDIAKYYEAHKATDLITFVKSFPYGEYLQRVAITDFSTLQNHRFFLYKKFHDGDPFLYYLGDAYVKLNPLHSTIPSLSERVRIGEAYLDHHQGFSIGTDEIYHTIGYFLLGGVAREIEHEIAHKKFDTNQSDHKRLIQQLEHRHIYVGYEEDTSNKILSQVKKGHWGYLLTRVETKLYERRWLVLGGMVMSLILALVLFSFGKKSHISVLTAISGLLTLAAVTGLVLVSVAWVHFRHQTSVSSSDGSHLKTNWKLALVGQYFAAPGTKDYSVQIFRITNQSGAEIGEAVWLLRPQIKANYLAFQHVHKRFVEMQHRMPVVLATTGGFTNAVHQPEGFTGESGNIINAVLMQDRHGLVLVESGGIRVLNLKNKQFQLPNGGPMMESPLESLMAYSQLIQWCRARKATFFQTQLLAFSNRVIIDERLAKPQWRERRLLALVSDPQTGRVEHIVFNLPNQQLLTDVAKDAAAVLLSRNKKIEAILNLDVGSYNIFNVYNESGTLLTNIQGTVDIQQATNLVVYTQ